MKKRLFLYLLPLFALISCADRHYDEPPILHIVAVDKVGAVVPGADVWLYGSEYDYQNGVNYIDKGRTNNFGEITFYNLDRRVYYYHVDHTLWQMDNYYTNNYTVKRLNYNEIFKALVVLEPY